MFSKAIVTPTGVIAGKLRLRFRGLLQKVRAIEDVDVTVPMTATPRPKCDKIPALASTITTTAAIALPHPSQNSQTSSSESEYSNELSEVSSQTDSASEPSTREFPVTPRNDQSPQSSYDFDSAPYDNNYEASVFGGVACGKEVYKELELDGEELEGNGMYAQSVESFEYEADPLGVGAWFGVSCDEEEDEYDDDEYEYEDDGVFEGPVDEEPDADTYEIEPVSGYYLEVKYPAATIRTTSTSATRQHSATNTRPRLFTNHHTIDLDLDRDDSTHIPAYRGSFPADNSLLHFYRGSTTTPLRTRSTTFPYEHQETDERRERLGGKQVGRRRDGTSGMEDSDLGGDVLDSGTGELGCSTEEEDEENGKAPNEPERHQSTPLVTGCAIPPPTAHFFFHRTLQKSIVIGSRARARRGLAYIARGLLERPVTSSLDPHRFARIRNVWFGGSKGSCRSWVYGYLLCDWVSSLYVGIAGNVTYTHIASHRAGQSSCLVM
ncbi:uncharacterized protein STEHIDRAFT_114991 [Stereum hirsutum FP-91666 SS1]|uniref:uncharacterized protein n=1 Tax=Stereum hirsutum (strain FP-91666) TaxID=721885 RepID=UPI000444A544|nr:uncharacterized protein STEHIDRAFT_114991 [Stereum hirsutum FP-91666 SS1]EIM81575.1 hypothetical protein STEHIDRAFT_114991 [Stereum hirsutum FP-91666 SS1]